MEWVCLMIKVVARRSCGAELVALHAGLHDAQQGRTATAGIGEERADGLRFHPDNLQRNKQFRWHLALPEVL